MAGAAEPLADEREDAPLEIESLCPRCFENGVTTILTTSIPHFRDIVIMAFDCQHCGTRNSELQPVMTSEANGILLKLYVPEGRPDVLSRQIVKSDHATVKIPELEFEVPAAGQKGCLTTIEGLLRQVVGDLMELQEDRWRVDPDTAAKIDAFCSRLEACASAEQPFTVELDDPSGNSFIESPYPSIAEDALLQRSSYQRTAEQSKALGLAVQEEENGVHHGPEARGMALDSASVSEVTGNAFIHQYCAPEEVMILPGVCLMCQNETETRMYPTKIPHFKEVIVMSNACEACGYKNSELRPGGGISAKGRRVTLTVTGKEDLDRDLIKSDSASIEIPCLSLTLRSGQAFITTVEGLIRRIADDLKKTSGFQIGDSADDADRAKYRALFVALEELLECRAPWSVTLIDPLANSFIMPLTESIDQDANLETREYQRSQAEDEEYGIDVLQQNAEH